MCGYLNQFMLFLCWVTDSDSASSSASESDAENVQSAGAGPKASHNKV